MKRPAFQNKRVRVLRMAFRARKVSGLSRIPLDWATIPEEKARQQSLSVVRFLGERFVFSLFRLKFSPNTSLDIPSLHNMLSHTQKNVHGVSRDVCEFFGAFILRGIIMEIYTTTSAWKVSYRVYVFLFCEYNVRRSYCYFSCKYCRCKLQWVVFHASILQPILCFLWDFFLPFYCFCKIFL